MRAWEAILNDSALNEVPNPFTPLFGKIPPIIAGRQEMIARFEDAFSGQASAPELCSIFTGVRGSGKTTMLQYLCSCAEEAGWVTARTTATKGMLDDLLQRAQASASHLADGSSKKLKSIEIASIGSLSWDNEESSANWRTQITDLLDELDKYETGILFAVDEVDGKLDEMVQLVTVFQMLIGENRKVALLMAGLPYRVSTLLLGKSTSFLRRAQRFTLGPIPDYDVKEAFRLTMEEGGKQIDSEALGLAAAAIKGFPFMFQLVGYRTWNAARGRKAIDADSVSKGVEIANEELAARVFDATLLELSKGDLEFLSAMNRDGSMTAREEIAEKLDRDSSWISRYKKRLLESGVVEEAPGGNFGFALPGFADYLTSQGL